MKCSITANHIYFSIVLEGRGFEIDWTVPSSYPDVMTHCYLFIKFHTHVWLRKQVILKSFHTFLLPLFLIVFNIIIISHPMMNFYTFSGAEF